MHAKLSRRDVILAGGTAAASVLLAGCAAGPRVIEPESGASGQTAPQLLSERTTDMATIKNILLVHGAFADGSSWAGVIRGLGGERWRLTAVQMPLTSLQDDVAAVRHVLDLQEGPTLLVGHSYGGAVISTAGDSPNVAGLVFVAAFAPDQGETLGELGARYAPPAGASSIQPDKAGYLWVDRDRFAQSFAQDVDAEQAREMAVVQKPWAGATFGQKPDRAAWRSKPTWYQVSENDRMINPELERFMAQRMGATTITLASSHASLVAHPKEIAGLITDAVASLDKR